MPKNSFLSQVEELLLKYTVHEDNKLFILNHFKYDVLELVKKEDPTFYNNMCIELDAENKMIERKVKPGDLATTSVYSRGKEKKLEGIIEYTAGDGSTAAMHTEEWGIINLPIDYFSIVKPVKGDEENETINQATKETSK